jgi:hypothetical protein
MVRTQIQLPEELYERAKRLAASRETSLAELTRRGVELLLSQYTEPDQEREPWQAPTVRGLGWRGLSHRQIKEAAQRPDVEERLEREAGRGAGA